MLEFEDRFRTEDACRVYLSQLRWPEGFRCPCCGRGQAHEPDTLAVPRLWPWRASDSGNGLPSHAVAPAGVVPGDLVGDEPEERGERLGTPTHPGVESLRDGMGNPAQAAASDGPPRSGAVDGGSRGGGNRRWGRRALQGQATRGRDQGAGRRRGGSQESGHGADPSQTDPGRLVGESGRLRAGRRGPWCGGEPEWPDHFGSVAPVSIELPHC